MTSGNLFNPVLGSEERVLSQGVSSGSVYFTTDTRKIYLDIDEDHAKLPMGGNIGLFYGDMKLASPAVEGQEEFEFQITDIVGNKNLKNKILQPNIDDLILNSDGCFYKVISVYGDILTTKKLTIAGTGGSGGGGTGDSGSKSIFSLSRLKFENPSIIRGKSCIVKFAAKLTDDLGDPVSGEVGSYTLYVNNIVKAEGKVTGITVGEVTNLDNLLDNEIMSLDVGPYLPAQGSSAEVKISVKGNNGSSPITRGGTVYISDMTLSWNYNEDTVHTWESAASSVKLEWEVSGSGFHKTTYIVIDGDISRKISVESTSVNQTRFEYDLNFSDHGLYHGAHSIEMWAKTSVGDAETDHVFKNLILVRGSTKTIISVGLFTKNLYQYDTVKIPIKIYNQMNTGANAEIEMYVNSESVGGFKDVANFAEKTWAFTPTLAGNDIRLEIVCGDGRWSYGVNIIPIEIDISERTDYAFKFKATDFSNNESIQAQENIDFSKNFDWINGGLQAEDDEEGGARQYFAVKAGTTMTIKYPLWQQNAPGLGKYFKFIFKAANCRDYDAQLLSCKKDKKITFVDKDIEYLKLTEKQTELTYSKNITVDLETNSAVLINPTVEILNIEDKDSRDKFKGSYVLFEDGVYQCDIKKVDEKSEDYYSVWYKTFARDSFDGIVINAQNASLKSNDRSLDTQYCEDNYIEFEAEITKEKRYIKFWIDGIPVNYVSYNTTDIFTGANEITIGSPDCDVYVYLLKIYEKELDLESHMQNFYADAPNANEMVRRYKRNDILYDGTDKNKNDIDPMKLAVANPDCLVHEYQIPRMTTRKKDPVYGCTYLQYKGSKTPLYTADNVMIKVQGTSSEAYVLAAANIDTDFQCTDNGNIPSGLKDSTGKVLTDGWSMDGGTAIPINYTCTKVNVASCENANNALNQEWYNMFQPYQSVLRCKNKRARDTMQFTNGVMFIYDENQTYDPKSTNPEANNVFGDTLNYLKNPYFKLYSLAQMGNSKDNIHVFHDLDNPLECCIEVRDNQTPQQWMVSDDYNKADIGEGEKYFEFRYPDGAQEASPEMIQGWNRLVTWMAHSNPSPKYNKFENITTVQQFNDFAINKITYKPIDVYVMNDSETAYEKVTSLQPGITTYYTETEHIHGYTGLKLPDSLTVEQRTFAPYTFKGFKAENQKDSNNKLWQKDYIPIVSQFTPINTYATPEGQPYTHDTYEYRMAKMLSECEDYLIMDSVLYHYLFIERHCMIDNVAKNTFWSTEDCVHWNLVKDYDNDTADGNDNNGHFTRTYGMEPTDRLNINTMVFNAHQSVWFNFCHGLYDACRQMYEKLDSKTVNYKGRALNLWNAKDYIWFFDQWQKIIPERCWIADYERKYFRPQEVYNKSLFNSMIEGGQKKYQRRQYETYQDIYMSSKYNGNSTSGSMIWFRPTGTGLFDVKVPITVYSDCYIRMEMGGNLSSERLKRNTVTYIKSPVNEANNSTMFLTPAKVFTSIGDLNNISGQIGNFAPDVAEFSGAPKLRQLIFSTENGKRNQGLSSGMTFAGNTLLEKLYVANLEAYTEGLDLSDCTSLLELNTANSEFTDVILADSAPTRLIELHHPTSLTLKNLNNLETLNVKNKDRLTSLIIKNIDNSENVNSKDLVEDVLDILDKNVNKPVLQYQLTDVQWTFNKNTDVIGSGENIEVPLFKTLLDETKAKPIYGEDNLIRIPYSAALSGKSTFTTTAYNGSEGLKIYDKYITADRFSDMNLEFKTTNTTLYEVILYDGDGKTVWKRKAAPGTNLNSEFLSAGPNGIFNVNILNKGETDQYYYEFLNIWDVKDDDGKIITSINKAYPTGLDINENLHLYPRFKAHIQSYTISVKYKHPITGIIKELKTGTYEYGTPLAAVVPSDKIPYVDRDGLSLTLYQEYDFKGYGLSSENNILVSDNYTVKYEETLWAIFELENDIRTITHPEWFDGIIETYEKEESTFGKHQGVRIYPKAGLTLSGKITLPSKFSIDGKEYPVINVSGFGGSSSIEPSKHKITHVFMEINTANTLYQINDYAFAYMPTLTYFDFENCLVRQIKTYAFRDSSALKLTAFGPELRFIGNHAFNSSLTSDVPVTVILPSTVKTIGDYGLANLKIPIGSNLQIGSSDQLSELSCSSGDCYKTSFMMNNKYTSITFYSKYYDDKDYDTIFEIFKAGLPDDNSGALTVH